MNNRAPARIKLGHRILNIRPIKSDSEEEDAYDGFYDANAGIIELNDNIIDLELLRTTLMHEIIHACCDYVGYRSGLALLFDDEEQATAIEEYMATSISKIVVAVIQDNPDLLRFLVDQ